MAALALACITVFAAKPGAVKITMGDGEAPQEGASGFALLNTPDEQGLIIVLVQVRGLDPAHSYNVRTGGNIIGDIALNKMGNGHMQAKIAPSLLGGAINVWIAGETSTNAGRVLRAWL